MEELLDDIRDTKKVRYLDFIPLLLVVLLGVWSGYLVFTKGYLISLNTLLAYLLAILAFGLYFVKRQYYIQTLSVAFGLGVFNILSWGPFGYVIWFLLPIQLISAVLLIVHLIVFYKDIEARAQQKRISKGVLNEKEVARLMERYRQLSDHRLEEIQNNKGYRKEAIAAATRTLKERNTSNPQ